MHSAAPLKEEGSSGVEAQAGIGPALLDRTGQPSQAGAEPEPPRLAVVLARIRDLSRAKSASNMRSTSAAKARVLDHRRDLERLTRKERVLKLAVPTVAVERSMSMTFSCRKPSPYR